MPWEFEFPFPGSLISTFLERRTNIIGQSHTEPLVIDKLSSKESTTQNDRYS